MTTNTNVYTNTEGHKLTITEMVTPYLKNAISKLERDIASGLQPLQAHLLPVLRAELNTRADA